MSGAGNDFILITDCGLRNPESGMRGVELKKLAIKLCDRKLGIGADGLLAVRKLSRDTLKVRYFNSDGSEAFCGNGSRCSAWWAYSTGLIPHKNFILDTAAGKLEARITGKEKVKLSMPDVSGVRLSFSGKFPAPVGKIHFLNTGVPHAVVPVSDLKKTDVYSLGRKLRYNPAFAPGGANVDFIKLKGKTLFIRTYERGVEDETLACGTGVTASAVACVLSGTLKSPVSCVTRGGDRFTVWLKPKGADSVSDIYLEGPAKIIYKGEI